MNRMTLALCAWLSLNAAALAVAVRRAQLRAPSAPPDRLALAIGANVFWATPGVSLNGTPTAGQVLHFACMTQEHARTLWRQWRKAVAA